MRFTREAIQAFRSGVEAYLLEIFEKANLACMHAGRCTSTKGRSYREAYIGSRHHSWLYPGGQSGLEDGHPQVQSQEDHLQASQDKGGHLMCQVKEDCPSSQRWLQEVPPGCAVDSDGEHHSCHPGFMRNIEYSTSRAHFGSSCMY